MKKRVLSGSIIRFQNSHPEKNEELIFVVDIFNERLSKKPGNIKGVLEILKKEFKPLLESKIADEYSVKYQKEDGNGSFFVFMLNNKKEVIVKEISFYDYYKYTPWEYRNSKRVSYINRRRYTFLDVLRKASSFSKTFQVVQQIFSWLSIISMSIAFTLSILMLTTDSAELHANSIFHPTKKTTLLILSIVSFILAVFPTLISTYSIVHNRSKIRKSLKYNVGGYYNLRWKKIYKNRLFKSAIPLFVYNIVSLVFLILFISVMDTTAYFFAYKDIPYVDTVYNAYIVASIFLTIRATFNAYVVISMIFLKKAVLRRHFNSEEVKSPFSEKPQSEIDDFIFWYKNPLIKVPYYKSYKNYFDLDPIEGYKHFKNYIVLERKTKNYEELQDLYKTNKKISNISWHLSKDIYKVKRNIERYRNNGGT